MNTKRQLSLLLVILFFASCAAAIPVNLGGSGIAAGVLQTPLPIPTISSGYVEVLEIYQDDGYGNQYIPFLSGEKAFFDADGQVLEIQDAQRRVVLQGLGNYRIKFYAWQDGFDLRVGSGQIMLKSGWNYTQNFTGIDWTREVIEVRQSGADNLLGYILLGGIYDQASGAYMGLEVPITFVDANQDGMIGTDEIPDALAKLHGEVAKLKDKTLAAGLETEINAAAGLIQAGSIADGYHALVNIRAKLDSAGSSGSGSSGSGSSAGTLSADAKQAKTNLFTLIGILVVLLAAIGFLTLKLLKPSKKHAMDEEEE